MTRACNYDGRIVLFDASLWDRINTEFGWSINKYSTGYWRVMCKRGQYRNKALARVLLDCPAGLQVDHIDGDSLNNTLANLRIVTHSQNRMNIPVFQGRKHLLAKGVYFDVRHKTYRSRIVVDGRVIELGTFKTPDEAELAYIAAAEQYHKEFSSYASRAK